MRTCIAIVVLVAVCGLFPGQASQAQMLQLVGKSGSRPMPGSQFWNPASNRDLMFPLHYRARIKPAYLLVGHDHPNGVQFLAMFPGRGVRLPLKFDTYFQGFDEYGELKPGYKIEVAEYDFDHDGVPEILIAVGDGVIDLSVNVVQYHAPRRRREAARAANWSLAGAFLGQAKAKIQADTITLPFGALGRHDEYRWVQGRFVQTHGSFSSLQ